MAKEETKKTVKKENKKKTTAKKTENKKVVAANKEAKQLTEKKSIPVKGIVIAVLVIGLLITLFAISEKKGVKYAETDNFTEEEQAELNNINVDDYLKLKAGSEASVIYIARPTCSHCQTQTPRMKYIKYKYKVEINYLNTDEFDEEGKDYEKLTSSDSYFENDFGTPTILVVQNDKILGDIAGEREVSGVVEFFKEYGLIKK